MTCSPSQTASRSASSPERERIRTHALALLRQLGHDSLVAEPDAHNGDAAIATALMDAFRATGDPAVFECLVEWAGPQLRARVRSRLRTLGSALDPGEVWQDAIVNIYRYPDRFLASRPGAFAAWSSTIVDNAIRRLLRCQRRGTSVMLRDPELLQEQADATVLEPSREAEDHEQCRATASAFGLVLQAYLIAYQSLGERERFVLQMVEVRCMRYAELAQLLAIRPEALKMVVFRARRRVHERLQELFAGGGGKAGAESRRGDAAPALAACVG